MALPIIIGTWSFSKEAVTVGSHCFQDKNSTAVDAVEAAINCVENDEIYGPCFVGKYGPPNAAGDVELDAAIMDGRLLDFGAVTALRGVPQAVSVARRVMENSPHSIISGIGAESFAKKQGFESKIEAPNQISHNESDNKEASGHDTLGVIARDNSGNLCAGVSTSGMSDKHPGRIGDSALPGCGLYADNTVGAACCTGDGDHILKFCPSFHVITLMKQGQSVGDACLTVVKEIMGRWTPHRKKPFEIGVLAMDKNGSVGAATTVTEVVDPLTKKTYEGFPYTVWREGMTEPEIVVCPVNNC